MSKYFCGQTIICNFVEGIKNPKGKVLVAVYDSINFLKVPVHSGMTKIEDGQEEVTVVIENIASGKYAVALFQDENDNNKSDTGSYGIPTEKYGFRAIMPKSKWDRLPFKIVCLKSRKIWK